MYAFLPAASANIAARDDCPTLSGLISLSVATLELANLLGAGLAVRDRRGVGNVEE